MPLTHNTENESNMKVFFNFYQIQVVLSNTLLEKKMKIHYVKMYFKKYGRCVHIFIYIVYIMYIERYRNANKHCTIFSQRTFPSGTNDV